MKRSELRPAVVIAFLGRAGSGKTTCAKWLEAYHGAKRTGFAYPLKVLAKRLLDFSDEQLYGPTHVKEEVDARYGFSPRQFLQRLGDFGRQVLGDTVWVDACFNYIASKVERGSLFTIDDCRYFNEAEAVKRMIYDFNGAEGYVIKLICPDSDSTADPNHPSEAEVDLVPDSYIDATIVSNLADFDLIEKLDKVLKELGIL